MLLATALELVTGALLERIFGQKWWDYSQEPWNFNGHICLKYSLVWGVLALFCLFLGNPLLVTLTNWIPQSVGQIIAIAVLVLLAADFAGSGAALLQLNGSLKARSPGGGGRCPTPWTTRSPGTSSGVWPGPTPAWIRTA